MILRMLLQATGRLKDNIEKQNQNNMVQVDDPLLMSWVGDLGM